MVDTSMNIGLYIGPSQNATYHDLVGQAVLADQLGYDSVWLTEKHFNQGRFLWSSPLITAGYMAAKTQNIKIGFAACVSTLHHPVKLAEDFANLDVFSHGRLIVGLTRTSLNEYCHEVFQSPVKNAWKKFNEQFDIMTKLWQNKLDKHSGSFYKIPAVKIYPLMLQKPLPPIFFITNSDESIVDAAKKGVGIFLHAFDDINTIKSKKKLYEDYFIDVLGLGPQVTLSRFIYVGANQKNAIADIEDPFLCFLDEQMPKVKCFLEKKYQTTIDFNFFQNELGIFGDVDFCINRIKSIAYDTGISNFTFLFNLITLGHKKSLDSMKRLASQLGKTLEDINLSANATRQFAK